MLMKTEGKRSMNEFRRAGALQSGTELFGTKERADTDGRYRRGRSSSSCMRIKE